MSREKTAIPDDLLQLSRRLEEWRRENCLYGRTRNFTLLFSVPLDVVTVTKPVVAPAGTNSCARLVAATPNRAAFA
jgi:hypothetical protein